MSSEASTSSKRVGRPRANGHVPEGDVREQILNAAAGLFVQHGYTATTTRRIAAAVGLRQGSLNHYFARKKDILIELLDRTLEPAFAADRDLDPALPPQCRLWILVSSDCANLAYGEQNLASLMLLPETRDDEFSDFWARREQLRAIYRKTISAGMASGALAPIDLDLAVEATFGLVESLAMWFDPQGAVSAQDASHHVARAALSGLLADPADADTVIAQSEQSRTRPDTPEVLR